MFEGMLRGQRNGKVYGAFAGIAIGMVGYVFGEDLANWRVDSYVWNLSMASEGSATWATIRALQELRDDAPAATWCAEFALDREECEEDPDAWYEEVVRPAALSGIKCLVDEDGADFKGGGSVPFTFEERPRVRAVLLCEGLTEHLEVVTGEQNPDARDEDYKIVSMRWVAAEAP